MVYDWEGRNTWPRNRLAVGIAVTAGVLVLIFLLVP
jgi:hypothetical protein